MVDTGVEQDKYDWSLEILSEYPFLADAKEYIKDEGPDLEELISGMAWEKVRHRGKERVIEALEDGKITTKNLDQKEEIEDELFSYPIARILVSCVNDNYLTKRYALGEAEKTAFQLGRESNDTILDIGKELGVAGKKKGENITVDFIYYIENTERLRSPEWKLVNQDLRGGKVFLLEKKYIRILKERLHQDVIQQLPRPVNDQIVDTFEDYIDDIEETLEETRSEFRSEDFGEIESDKYPPCIRELLSLQNEGVNLSHEGRFALTSFLHKIGMSEEGILNLFSEAPDFDRELALYQIEHIIGKVSGTEYTPPGCDAMKTNGICRSPDRLCKQDWMNHPLSYYSVKKSDERNEKKEKEEDE